jgi:hypothetical protein
MQSYQAPHFPKAEAYTRVLQPVQPEASRRV